ncbi:acetate/propionate family kinase [bacterium 3DAC]|nr:acetate kinase [Dictyoglomota bacterium]UZN22709.1 acetate/propionate family kinase [bacterium 3DAC]
MDILVLNSGSSSIKFQVISMPEEKVIAKGIVERIGLEEPFLKYKKGDGEYQKFTRPDKIDHKIALQWVLDTLTDKEIGVLESLSSIGAVGHRVVHGGEAFSGSVLITDEVIKALEDNIELAPLHNPANLMGIYACKELMPGTPMVGVFDTAFHQTMPKHAYLYALPIELYEKYRVRRYGFHGTSHRYVSQRAAELVGKPIEELKIITVHVGNGASVAAVKYGKSVDTSMGFTPLEGLVMGTRCGDIDPALPIWLQRKFNMTPDEVDQYLNKKSGILGLMGGKTYDMREVEDGYLAGEPDATLAFEIYAYRIKKYIGAYAAAMGGLDVLVFTAGVGENSPPLRELVCRDLEFLGIKIDKERNNVRGTALISTDDSKVKVFSIATNEELVIARDTYEIVTKEEK